MDFQTRKNRLKRQKKGSIFQFILLFVFIIIALDIFIFVLWILSGQCAIDNFHAGRLTSLITNTSLLCI
jgi:hypothetical protein